MMFGIVRNKFQGYDNGTNRRQIFRDEIKEYRWMKVGFNFVLFEIQVAFLRAQLRIP